MVIPNGFLIRKTVFALILSFLFLFSFHILPSTKTKQPEISLQLKEIKEGNYWLLVANKKAFLLQYHLKSLDQRIAGDEYTMKIPTSREITNCPEVILKARGGWRISEVKLGKHLAIDDEIIFAKGNLVIHIKCNIYGYKMRKGELYLLIRCNCFRLEFEKHQEDWILAEKKYDMFIDWTENNEVVLGDDRLCWENQGVQGGTN